MNTLNRPTNHSLRQFNHWLAALCMVLLYSASGPRAAHALIPCTVTTTDDGGPGTLRDALANASNGDTICFNLTTPATITLTNGELVVSNSVTIVGPGPANLAVDGNDVTRVFHVQGGVIAAISGLTVTNGDFGGAAGNGGGILNDNSTLTVSNCVITGNLGGFGGGLANDGFNGSNATLTVIACIVSGNLAGSGGGVANLGQDTNSATLTITNCTLTSNFALADGGAVFNVGINSGNAIAEIIDSTLANNSATNRGGAVSSTGGSTVISAPGGNAALKVVHSSVASNSANFGGGIFSAALIGGNAKLEISNSTISSNTASSNGGGIIPNGGGAALGSSLGGTATNIITGTTFRENSAANGGGLSHAGNSLLILANSTIISNAVLGSGGGILDSENSTLLVSNSTLSGNSAGNSANNDGGGLFVGDIGGRVILGNPTIEIFGSTISENSAYEGAGIASRTTGSELMNVKVINSTLSSNIASFGGGIINYGKSNGTASIEFANTTFSGNSASVGGGILNTTDEGGTATVVIVDTIFNAGALGENIANPGLGDSTVTSLGYNLSSDSGGGFLTGTGDQTNTPPLLGPLQDNGGPTLTHALLVGSPAIDAGDPNFTPPPGFDQRGPGFDRVVNGRIDIGAFEVQTAAPPAIITCEVQFFTNTFPNDVQVTTNACGTGANVGVAAGTFVTEHVIICADAGNGQSVSNFHIELTQDGNFFGSASSTTMLAPGECQDFFATGSNSTCSNSGVRTFAATVTASDGAATTCTNTLECCAQHITCDLQFLTNSVLVTTNACGTGAVAGVATGAVVSVQLEVCADAANSGPVSDFSAELTVDGTSFGSASVSGTNVAPGDCLTLVTITTPFICTNAAVRTFAATVTSSLADPTACTNMLECCMPPPPATRCPLTVGYWKNHPNAWPVTTLALGCKTYTQAELLAILGMATGTGPKADASLILADQLIAAKLNIANGSDPAPVAATITAADNLLCGFSGKLPYKVRTNSIVGKAMVRDANLLNSYNNARLTPNCTR